MSVSLVSLSLSSSRAGLELRSLTEEPSESWGDCRSEWPLASFEPSWPAVPFPLAVARRRCTRPSARFIVRSAGDLPARGRAPQWRDVCLPPAGVCQVSMSTWRVAAATAAAAAAVVLGRATPQHEGRGLGRNGHQLVLGCRCLLTFAAAATQHTYLAKMACAASTASTTSTTGSCLLSFLSSRALSDSLALASHSPRSSCARARYLPRAFLPMKRERARTSKLGAAHSVAAADDSPFRLLLFCYTSMISCVLLYLYPSPAHLAQRSYTHAHTHALYYPRTAVCRVVNDDSTSARHTTGRSKIASVY